MFSYGLIAYSIMLILVTFIIANKKMTRDEKIVIKEVVNVKSDQGATAVYSSTSESITFSAKSQALFLLTKEKYSVDEVMNRLDLRCLKDFKEKIAAAHQDDCFEMRLKIKRDFHSEIWVNSSIIMSRSGKTTLLSMTFEDISKIVELETKNRMVEATLKSIIENTKMISFVAFDQELKVLMFNKRFSQKIDRYFQHKLERHQNILDLLMAKKNGTHYLADITDTIKNNIEKTLLGEKLQSIDKITLDSGECIFLECEYSPITVANKQPMGGVVFFRDVTREFQIKEQLIKEREVEQSANAAKSKFLSSMGHEIRTPLNGVIGMTDLLFDTELSSKQQYLLTVVKESGKSLLAIVNDILDFSKIEAGEVEFVDVAIQVRVYIESIQEMFRYKCEEKNLRFKIEISDDVPLYILIDSLRLKQVLINLIGNAIKFTEQGYIGITVEKVDSDLRFSVEDTGIGIPQEKCDHIFRAFKQVSDDTTRKYGGTGLGLSISKELIELMHGRIKVISKVALGTVFYFTLPLRIPTKDDFEVTQTNNELEMGILKGMNILVAEDNEINQVFMEEILNKFNCNIQLVSNGLEAVDAVKQNFFDCVLMDVSMPEMDGIEATKVLRQTYDLDQLPIIAVTAHASEDYKDMLLESGVNEYITKPIDTLRLLKVLSKYIKAIDKVDFDFKTIEKNVMGNSVLVVELSHQLVKMLNDEVIPGVIDAIEENSFEKALNLTHKAKGSISNFGKSKLLETFKALDHAVRENKKAESYAYIETIKVETSLFSESINRYDR